MPSASKRMLEKITHDVLITMHDLRVYALQHKVSTDHTGKILFALRKELALIEASLIAPTKEPFAFEKSDTVNLRNDNVCE